MSIRGHGAEPPGYNTGLAWQCLIYHETSEDGCLEDSSTGGKHTKETEFS